jgi:lon-related putative ATP-dependent protease
MKSHSQAIQSNKTASMSTAKELSVEHLARLCPPDTLSFATTVELPDLKEVIGQPRAFKALELGCEVSGFGYNIFILGMPDSGRTTLTRGYLQLRAASGPTLKDWCYVNNFDNPRRPRALQLPAGLAVELRKEMRLLVAECKLGVPRVFASEEYTRERDRLVNAMKAKLEQELTQLEEFINRYNFILIKTPYGLFLGPGIHGKPIKPEEFENLNAEQKEKLNQLQDRLSTHLDKTLAKLRDIEQTTKEEIQELDLRTALFIIRPIIDKRREKFANIQPVQEYLDQVQTDLIHSIDQLRPNGQKENNPLEERAWAIRYNVNVLVDHTNHSSAPVIIENQPTYHNLLGTIEHDIFLGASYTDFSQIRPGALHKANGGYLILPARDVLINPYAWEGLKRVLRDREIRMLELGSQMGLISTATLDPEPIPVNVKVILVGTPTLYYLIHAYDEDFAKLFKIRAEFATRMERNPQSESDYALYVRSVIDANKLPPFDRTAVARIIEHGARMVGDQDKLSTQFGIIADLICEAAYWARKRNQTFVDAPAVQKALDERSYRSNLIQERIQDMIREKLLIVDVDGSTVGQINALSVLSLGDYSFGRPCRVTASVCAGQAGVVDIERQARLGGPIHTKGVLIISGFLGKCYGQSHPLNLTASLTFEQSYDEIDGDSASAAELIALLSALADIPIDQSKAITGSVNQHGQIQAIGGVNEKIEGFFETCRQNGLTGRQGVIIPYANRRNLMLKKEVREAVSRGGFHIWAVKTVDEVVLLLTGCNFGRMQGDGTYPQGSFNQAVICRLEAFARVMDDDYRAKMRRNNQTRADSILEED